MAELLEVLLLDYNVDVNTQLPKVLSRLISVACRLASKGDKDIGQSVFGLQVLKTLGQSGARPILVPHSRTVRQACLILLSTLANLTSSAHDNGSQQTLIALLSETYALYSSMESSDMWTANWSEMVQESSAVLAALGVGASSSKSSAGGVGAKKQQKDKSGNNGNKITSSSSSSSSSSSDANKLTLLPGANIFQLRGTKKAISGAVLFNGLCCILANLLKFGCSSGFIGLPLTTFMPMLQMLLSTSAELNTKDPVVSYSLNTLHSVTYRTFLSTPLCFIYLQAFIEGDFGVAPFDISLVLSMMKVRSQNDCYFFSQQTALLIHM